MKIADLIDKGRKEENARRVLRGEDPLPDTINDGKLVHFLIDINIDGVQLFHNSEQAGIIPILAVIYSGNHSADSTEDPVVIQLRHPFVIGFYIGKSKPDLTKFLEPLFAELNRLCPNNVDPEATKGREFTASLRCVIADSPMRAYLKKCKGHSGYWSCERCIQKGISTLVSGNKKETIEFRELNAPPRTDEDFATYCKSDESVDDHISNPNNVGPFYEFGFCVISGFVIDPMHTMSAGAFGRRLRGITLKASEGKLEVAELKQADYRINMFRGCKPYEFERFLRPLKSSVKKYKHHELRDFMMYYLFPVFNGLLKKNQLENILLLQYSMILLGGFQTTEIPANDITEATRILKLYVQQLIDFQIPIRPTTHAIIHLPEDVANFKCGIESLSAYVFENFQGFFCAHVISGNKTVEQLKNRLIERYKYLLPTLAVGSIITSTKLFELEVAKEELRNSVGHRIVVDFTIGRGVDPMKKLTFPDMIVTNKFPKNILLMTNGSVVVCTDIKEHPEGSNIFWMNCAKFRKLENAFVVPFVSSKYEIYLVSQYSELFDEFNANKIAAKMFAFPNQLKPDCDKLPNIIDPLSSQKWFVTPIRHSLIS